MKKPSKAILHIKANYQKKKANYQCVFKENVFKAIFKSTLSIEYVLT